MTARNLSQNTELNSSVAPTLNMLEQARTDQYLRAKLHAFFPEFLTEIRELNIPTKAGTAKVWVKDERKTFTGTFKCRGAMYLISELVKYPRTIENGFVLASTGNHGFSVSKICSMSGCRVDVFLPQGASQEKVKKIEGVGGRIFLSGSDLNESIELAREYAQNNNKYFIDSLDSHLIFGHASLALEVARQAPNVNYFMFPIGIGAGICGQIVGTSLSGSNANIVGVTHASATAWKDSLIAERSVFRAITAGTTPGLEVSKPREEILSFVRNNISECIEVSDQDLFKAVELFDGKYASSDLTSFVGLAGVLKFISQYGGDGVSFFTAIC